MRPDPDRGQPAQSGARGLRAPRAEPDVAPSPPRGRDARAGRDDRHPASTYPPGWDARSSRGDPEIAPAIANRTSPRLRTDGESSPLFPNRTAPSSRHEPDGSSAFPNRTVPHHRDEPDGSPPFSDRTSPHSRHEPEGPLAFPNRISPHSRHEPESPSALPNRTARPRLEADVASTFPNRLATRPRPETERAPAFRNRTVPRPRETEIPNRPVPRPRPEVHGAPALRNRNATRPPRSELDGPPPSPGHAHFERRSTRPEPPHAPSFPPDSAPRPGRPDLAMIQLPSPKAARPPTASPAAPSAGNASARAGSRPGATTIQRLLQARQLEVVFQPIVDLHTGRVFAQEALARSLSSHFRDPPSMFEAAIGENRCGELGRTLRGLAVEACPDLPLFLNVHPNELNERWVVQPDDPLFYHEAPVYLEITESVPLSHFEFCNSILREIRNKGIYLVVDDLGAGYSNLKYIADLAPEVVKLDRSLIAGVETGSRLHRLLRSIVDLCEAMGASVVAEGVETVDELRILRDVGIRYAQGYALARPGSPPPTVDSNWIRRL